MRAFSLTTELWPFVSGTTAGLLLLPISVTKLVDVVLYGRGKEKNHRSIGCRVIVRNIL